METCNCAYTLKIYMKAQKHACFHVFSPFSAHLYYIMGEGLWDELQTF